MSFKQRGRRRGERLSPSGAGRGLTQEPGSGQSRLQGDSACPPRLSGGQPARVSHLGCLISRREQGQGTRQTNLSAGWAPAGASPLFLFALRIFFQTIPWQNSSHCPGAWTRTARGGGGQAGSPRDPACFCLAGAAERAAPAPRQRPRRRVAWCPSPGGISFAGLGCTPGRGRSGRAPLPALSFQDFSSWLFPETFCCELLGALGSLKRICAATALTN